ncbi:ABC transporter substrate-binding protein [Cryobacterium melibiosiphilum]|uniref:Thiamine pyrimidine synthase n=1 Tax=Cryobacterium melibiosiphilum TaxID=995039 RepID=A0A3A5MMT6_9MICO|nr:ABC transporter substrate-binding protein [Cryobacterium melibiosiphilum]RJT88213.1 ABC transporter substrate-binding protein [Cryobacterium melibiosiphilum]
MTQPLRSHFASLRRARRTVQAIAAALLVSVALSACAGSADDSDAGAADAAADGFGAASIQLSWIKNAEFMGEIVAENEGYFTDAGFDSVDLVAGPSAIEASVLAGTVDMGIGNAVSTGTVVANEGAPLKIIGATYQKNPFSILSLEDNGNIATIDDLKGKTIGVQASNLNLWEAFLKVNDIDEADVTTLPVEYDPTPLFNGEVDGWFAYLTNESIDADLKGLKPVNLPLADNGLPFVAETFTVTDDALENDREKLKALLVAEIRGWTDALKDTDMAATLVVEGFGSEFGLTIEKETLQAEIQAADLVVSEETAENGLFTISSDLQDESISTLAAAGITVTADQLFDLSLLAEVYDENPELLDYTN